MTISNRSGSEPERVLIVDDTKSIRDFLTNYVLRPRGFEVIIATNGLEGLKLAAANEPDLMIVDNQMPQLTGLELLKTLRESGLEVPAIMMTAHGSEQIAVEAFRLGIRDYVIKPFEVEVMSAAIDRALRESRLERERDELTHKLVDSNLQMQRRVQELNTLYGIGKSVSSSLDLEEVLHRVVEGAVYVTSAEEGSLMLLDRSRGELYVRASKNLDRNTESLRLKVSDTLAGEALKSQRPLILNNDDSRHQAFLDRHKIKSLLYLPLLAHNEPLGVLSVANRYRDVLFTERETRVVSPLADFAAVAIRNARLYAQTENERHKLQAVISQTDDPILLVDEQGRLALANAAACLALQIPTDDSIGRTVTDLVQEPEAVTFITQPTGPNFSPHDEITVRDGRVFNAHMTPIRGIGRAIVMRDITQLKELDRLKSELVSIVSHDLRSPLTSILGYIDLLQQAGPMTERQDVFIRRIQNSVGNITHLISDLLDLGRLEAGAQLALVPCAIDALLNEVSEDLRAKADAKSQTLQVELAALPKIMGDPNQLRQAFDNLLVNAAKYTPVGGSICLEAYIKDGQVVVTIRDTGPGIPPADQPYIFDKFYRAENVSHSHEGLGLGLSIVKSIIERHQGRIWVQSEADSGATFFVVLPATAAVS